MTTAEPTYQLRPFLKIRRGYLHGLETGRRKNIIHGLIEVDVTRARALIDTRKVAGEDISLTAFTVYAVARAVAEDRILHGYRQRNQIVLFDDVDVNIQVESNLEGQKIVASIVVRAANRKTIGEITQEIRAAQRGEGLERRYRGSLAFLTLPRPLRSRLWAAMMANPFWFKRFGGTVGLSAIGMFGPSGGWGIPIAPPTLMITIGGITTKPRYRDGRLEPRELLAITVSVDHDIVDGASAARFARRLDDLLDSADGLTENTADQPAALPLDHLESQPHAEDSSSTSGSSTVDSGR